MKFLIIGDVVGRSGMDIIKNNIDSIIQKENIITASGSINTKGPQVFIRVDGAYDDLEKIKNTSIVANGHTFKLSDIADVKRGYEDPPSFIIHNNS